MSNRIFIKGQEVEFQDYKRCWIKGTVQAVEEGKLHVVFRDSMKRAPRVIVLNQKRVRATNGSR